MSPTHTAYLSSCLKVLSLPCSPPVPRFLHGPRSREQVKGSTALLLLNHAQRNVVTESFTININKKNDFRQDTWACHNSLNIIKEQGYAANCFPNHNAKPTRFPSPAHAGFATGIAPFLMLQRNTEIVYVDFTALFLLTKTIRKCT